MSIDNGDSSTMPTNPSEWMGITSSRALSIRSSSGRHQRNPRSNVSDSEDESPGPSVKLLKTKDYSNVSRIVERDHLTDENWHEWKDRML